MPTDPIEILQAAWQKLKDHYPMMEYMGAQGDEWLEEFQPRVAAAPTPEVAFDLIEEMVCRLNDYHTRFLRPGGSDNKSSPNARAEVVLEGQRRAVDDKVSRAAIVNDVVHVCRDRQAVAAEGVKPCG